MHGGEYSEIKLEPVENGASSMEYSNYNKAFTDEYSKKKGYQVMANTHPLYGPPDLVACQSHISEYEKRP